MLSESRPLRIVHVLRAPVGGLFRHVLDLSREQIARGHEVGLITDSLTGGALGDTQLARLEPSLALGLMRLPIQRLPDLSDVVALARVSRRLSQLKPHVVHGHGSKGGVFARLAGSVWSVSGPVRCYTPHGGSLNYEPGSKSHQIFMLLEWLLAWRTDLLLFESGYIAGRYETSVGRHRHLARIVRNGISAAELEPTQLAPNASDLLYVGEFRAAKGLDTLIDALGLLAKSGRRPSLTLVGDGPEKCALLKRAERLGVASQLVVQSPMRARDAFMLGRIMIVPSRAESLPYIVLEAAGAQRTMIATNVGGMGEIFGPYADRLIPSNDPELLRRAIAAALDEPAEIAAQKAQELASFVGARFSLSMMVDDVISGYCEAMSARKLMAPQGSASAESI